MISYDAYIKRIIDMKKNRVLRQITLWRVFRVIAITVLVVVILQVIAEAYSLNQDIIWLKDKFLRLVWESPQGGSHHYRIEVMKTDLLAGPVTTSLYYEYTDSNRFEMELLDDHSYSFRVQAVSLYGALSDYSAATPLYIYDEKQAAVVEEEAAGNTPLEFSLSQNYPNPFNGSTKIEYEIPNLDMDENGGNVRLTIYNMLGQRVKELVNANVAPGKYSVTWDGRNENGVGVASAHYIYYLEAGDYKVAKRMVYVK